MLEVANLILVVGSDARQPSSTGFALTQPMMCARNSTF
jgi:hypothetical protein